VPLTSGVHLGPYEIFSLLGSGSMGVDVYRGRDPRLGRDVAIKVFPANASADPVGCVGSSRRRALLRL
jgi:serine/threonine protein kinase